MTPKDVLTNPYFCPMPWTGLMYNFDGNVKNCIRSSAPIGNIQDDNIVDILKGNTNINTQNRIVSETPVSTCRGCYDLEQGKKGFDHISDRVFYIRELKHVPTNTYHTGNFDLKTVDARWTNLCNFACVYCSPEFSSRWADELNITQERPDITAYAEFKQYVFDRARELKHVYLAGGEPLLMKENLELLELLQQVNPDVNLRINSNLSKTDTRVFDKVCEFKNVHWIVSIESVDDRFEYIRHGAKWQDFTDNLTTINQLGHKISFNMLYFLLNYLDIFDCLRWLQHRGFHNNSFIVGALTGPVHLDVRHLPDHKLEQVTSTIQHWLSTTPGFLLDNGLRNILDYIQQPFNKNLSGALAEIAKLDQRRGVDSHSVFPELYK